MGGVSVQRMVFATVMVFVFVAIIDPVGILDKFPFISWVPWRSLFWSSSLFSTPHSIVKRHENNIQRITDLTCNLKVSEGFYQLQLSWTVPQDSVSFYEVRYGSHDLYEENFQTGILAATYTDAKLFQAGQLASVLTDNISISILTSYFVAVKICYTDGACEVTNSCQFMFEDIPERIKDLTCKVIHNEKTKQQQLMLTWTVPFDFGAYQVRYSRNVLSNINWVSGTQVMIPEPQHLFPGDQASITTVPFSISRGIHYYAAVRATHAEGVSSVVSYPCIFGIDAGITDLSVRLLRTDIVGLYQVVLMWHATNTEHSYEVRLATWSLTEDSFMQGQLIKSITVASVICWRNYQFISEPVNLLDNTEYYVAVKSSWDQGLSSAISNTVVLNVENAIAVERVTDFSFVLIPQPGVGLYQLSLKWAIPKGAMNYKILYSTNQDLSGASTLKIPNNKLSDGQSLANIITQTISLQLEMSYYFVLETFYKDSILCLMSNIESTSIAQDFGSIKDLSAEVIPNISTKLYQLELTFTPPFDVDSYEIHYGDCPSAVSDLLQGPLLETDNQNLWANTKTTVITVPHNFEIGSKYCVIVIAMKNDGLHEHCTVSNACEFYMDEGFPVMIEDLQACPSEDPKTHHSKISLTWSSSFQVQSYEVRFSDCSLNKENFERGTLIPISNLMNVSVLSSPLIHITSEPINIPQDVLYYVYVKAIYRYDSLISNGAKIIVEDIPASISDLECAIIETGHGGLPRLELQWTVPTRVLQYDFAYWEDHFEIISRKQDEWPGVEDVTYFHVSEASKNCGTTAQAILENMYIDKNKKYAVGIHVSHKMTKLNKVNTGCKDFATYIFKQWGLSSNICYFILVDYPESLGDLIVYDICDLCHLNYKISLKWRINNKGQTVMDYEIRYSTAWFNEKDFNTAFLINKDEFNLFVDQKHFEANITEPIFQPDIKYYLCVKVEYKEISYSIFSNTVDFMNQVLPENINDLVATVEMNELNKMNINLNWTVPIKVLDYEVRYSRHLITESNFMYSTSVELSTQPSKFPGEEASANISAKVLKSEVLYYIALKVKHQGLFKRLLSNVATIKVPALKDSANLFYFDEPFTAIANDTGPLDDEGEVIKPLDDLLILPIMDFCCQATAAKNNLHQLECSWTIPYNVAGYEIWYSSEELSPANYNSGWMVDTLDTQWCYVFTYDPKKIKQCTYPGLAGEKAQFTSCSMKLQFGTQYYVLLRVMLTTKQWLFSNVHPFLVGISINSITADYQPKKLLGQQKQPQQQKLLQSNYVIHDLAVCPKGPNALSFTWTVPYKVISYSICFNGDPYNLPDLEMCEPWSQPDLLGNAPGTQAEAFVAGNFVKRALEAAKTLVCLIVDYNDGQRLFSNVVDIKQDIITMYEWLHMTTNEGVDIEIPLRALSCVDPNDESRTAKVTLQWISPFDESYYEFRLSVNKTSLMPGNFALAPIIYIPEVVASDKVFIPTGDIVRVETYLNLMFGEIYFIAMQAIDRTGRRSEPSNIASFVVSYC